MRLKKKSPHLIWCNLVLLDLLSCWGAGFPKALRRTPRLFVPSQENLINKFYEVLVRFCRQHRLETVNFGRGVLLESCLMSSNTEVPSYVKAGTKMVGLVAVLLFLRTPHNLSSLSQKQKQRFTTKFSFDVTVQYSFSFSVHSKPLIFWQDSGLVWFSSTPQSFLWRVLLSMDPKDWNLLQEFAG